MICLISSSFFFFNDTSTTEIYTLSLHDALPIFGAVVYSVINIKLGEHIVALCQFIHRSEERFSRNAETDLVCRLLLEKKNVSRIFLTEARAHTRAMTRRRIRASELLTVSVSLI